MATKPTDPDIASAIEIARRATLAELTRQVDTLKRVTSTLDALQGDEPHDFQSWLRSHIFGRDAARDPVLAGLEKQIRIELKKVRKSPRLLGKLGQQQLTFELKNFQKTPPRPIAGQELGQRIDTPIDLRLDSAHKVALDAELDDLRRAIGKLDSWSDKPAQTLDMVYIDRCLRLLRSRSAQREDVEALIEHLGWAAHDRRREALNALALPYFDRWRMLRDLLVARRDALIHGVDESLLARKHVRAMLELLGTEAGGLPQAEIGERLGLAKVNLTRILNLLESHGVIERRREGTSNRVFLVQPIPSA